MLPLFYLKTIRVPLNFFAPIVWLIWFVIMMSNLLEWEFSSWYFCDCLSQYKIMIVDCITNKPVNGAQFHLQITICIGEWFYLPLLFSVLCCSGTRQLFGAFLSPSSYQTISLLRVTKQSLKWFCCIFSPFIMFFTSWMQVEGVGVRSLLSQSPGSCYSSLADCFVSLILFFSIWVAWCPYLSLWILPEE